jgi:hypothetical protein
MFKINNNVNLNLKNLLIMTLIISTLVILYNKAYIDSTYVPIEKYKNSVKKHKNLIESYMAKIKELEQHINNQNKIIQQLNSDFSGQLQQIGTHTSAHNASLTPSRFNPNENINQNNFSTPSRFNPNENINQNNFSTPINELLPNNYLNQQISNRQLSSPLQRMYNERF